MGCQIKTPPANQQSKLRGETRWDKICVGEDYWIPPTFRREHQFRITYFELQTRLGCRHLAHPIGLRQLHHRDLHTLARSRQACSVTHRKDYKPFQSVIWIKFNSNLKYKEQKFWGYFIYLSRLFSKMINNNN